MASRASDHPFSLYRKFGVPVALSTDDEGISRIDLTHEYVRAVETYDLSYADLKHIVRNSLEYSFLPGPSLWASPDYARLASACESDAARGEAVFSLRGLPQGKREGGAAMGAGEALPRLRAGERDTGTPRRRICICRAYEVELIDKRNGTRIEAHVHPATGELLLGYDD